MKSFFTVLCLFVVVYISFGQNIQDDSFDAIKKNLSIVLVGIESVACQEGCADKINDNLNKVDDVVSAVVSYDKKKAIITFDSETITLEKVKKSLPIPRLRIMLIPYIKLPSKNK